jgi:hypothetical protein
MNDTPKIRWKWGAMAALAMALLGLYPQINLWMARGSEWAGSYVPVQGDEVAYSAYINALIDGRPRRNDPYTGRDDAPGQAQPESLFSIQFIPAYLIALPARALGVSASTAFIALIFIAAIASSLAIFWLLTSVTGDDRVAAVGALAVLCLGTLTAAQGQARLILGLPIIFDDYFPFLRRYQPSATFPLFFVLCVFVWRALKSESQRLALAWGMGAAALFAVLVFSYFYLWTAAAAWLACLLTVWLVARPAEWKRVLATFAPILVFAVIALVPYFILLSHRAANMESAQLMTFSHAPDLFRVPEMICFAVILALVFGARRKMIEWRDRTVLFVASLALMPFVAFNQQVITGRSLQPMHYEIFIANYVALVALILAAWLLVRGREAEATVKIPNRAFALAALALFGWGIVEATGAARRNVAQARLRDEAMPVAKWLAEEAKRDGTFNAKTAARDPRPVVFSSSLPVADGLPTGAPQAQLFVRHMASFASASSAERKERFYQYMYYSGVTERDLAQAITEARLAIMAELFGIDRVIPGLTADQRPVTLEEARTEVRLYSEHINSFTHERASRPALSYVIVPTEAAPDLSNLDRWYERDRGEQVGKFTIYRVKLRQEG